MDEYKHNKSYGPLISILVILLLLIISAFFVFRSAVMDIGKKDIIIDKKQEEIYINKTKKELNEQEVDIDEVAKKLDELDINFDDVLKELDI